MIVRCTLLLLLVLGTHAALWSQDLRGIVNRYHRVVAYDTCRQTLTVDPIPTVVAGDRILVHQSKGAVIDTTDGPQFGRITSLANAGVFEFATVYAVRGNEILLQTALRRRYDPADGMQCVTMPMVASARVVDTVRAMPWDGVTGGIIVLVCSDTLTIAAPVIAAGQGFRGGRASVNASDTSQQAWTLPDGHGGSGRKGESIVALPSSAAAGRAPNASGGGGGNARNGGGGGGGGISIGGGGGDQTTEYVQISIGGLGGYGIVPSSTDPRVFFGGGGGGGHQNDMLGSDGGNGGGIVIIVAGTLVQEPTGYIDVSGQPAGSATGDGAGGGGAGGTVVFDVGKAPRTVTTLARGGAGGDATGTNRCYGPGGGGAGGAILLTNRSQMLQSDVNEQFLGGRAGMYLGNAVECPDSSNYGATPGAYGAVTRTADIPLLGPPVIHPALLTRDTTICEGDSIDLRVAQADAVRWITSEHVVNPSAASTRTRALRASVTLVVELTMRGGCIVRDSLRVTVRPRPTPRLSYTATSITPTRPSIDVSVSGTYRSYRWSDGRDDSTINITTPGPYWVTVVDSNGCEGQSDTVWIRTSTTDAVVRLYVQDATIRPGEITRIPIRLTLEDSLLAPTSTTFTLTTRATMLVPSNERITGTTSDVRLSIVSTTLDRTLARTTMVLRCDIGPGGSRRRTISIPFIGALGDSSSCQIGIPICQPADASLDCIVDREGRARMDTVCEQNGRTRLFDPLADLSVIIRNGGLEYQGSDAAPDVDLVDVLGRPYVLTCVSTGSTTFCTPQQQLRGAAWWIIRRGSSVRVLPVLFEE